MSESDTYRRRAETLLRKASEAVNMKERSQLIDEAMHWHMLAMDARESHDRDNDNDGDLGDEAEARG
jgi:hypothetical protein